MNIYDRIKIAWKANRGLRLSADDVFTLMCDTAIHDAVTRANEWESEVEEKERREARRQRQAMDKETSHDPTQTPA